MKIAFTVCSNNYLAQSITLADSIKAKSKEWIVFIGLVDKKSNNINYDKIPHRILTIDEIGLAGIDDLWKKYDIIELNTSVKPAFFRFIFSNFSQPEYVFYFDPDIKVYSDLDYLLHEFGPGDFMILTPHILLPIPLDDKIPQESIFLNHGVYNLGFLGLKKSLSADSFISWWMERTMILGFRRLSEGLFVDQLWLNLVPVFYDGVKICKNPGCNVAPWNIQERDISCNNGSYWVNSSNPLLFYHFSNFKYQEPEIISKLYNRMNGKETEDLKNLYRDYYNDLIKNNIGVYSKVECFYINQKTEFVTNEYLKEIRSSNIKLAKHYLKRIKKRIDSILNKT
ncbi:MAG: hypothetical protein ABSG89_07050 [Bacteroidales bacterium]|jgi:predicted DNA binding CopG/RHH family protein